MAKKSLPAPTSPRPPATVEALPEGGRVVAFIVGIETYQTAGKIKKVDFAHADAEAFAEALRSIYPEDRLDIEIYLDSDATQGNLRYYLPQTIAGLGEDDLFVFYYAGHGYHGVGGNRITAWDSHAYEPENTTLLLSELLIEPLAASDCQRALAFVDACGTPIKSAGRSVLAEMNRAELEAFLGAATYSTIFLACGAGQQSYPSEELRHGVWTHFLLKALRGEAPEALGPGRYLTDTSLQDYLAVEVPRYVTRSLTVKGQQKPTVLSRRSSTFQIRHVPEPVKLVAPEGDFSEVGVVVRQEYFEKIEGGPVKSLPGFIKGVHFTSKIVTSRSNSFVTERLTPGIDEEVQELYKDIKRVFGLRRNDIQRENNNGQASFDTDHFRYSIQSGQDPNDPEDYLIARRLEFRDGAEAEIDRLDELFGAAFDRIVVKFDRLAFDFDELVDFFEDVQDEHGGDLEENQDKQVVTYTPVGGPKIEFNLAKMRLRISGPRNQTPSALMGLARKVSIGTSPNQRLLK